MRDHRYSPIQTSEGWADGLGRRFPTDEEAYASFADRAKFAESVAGRSLTRSEVLRGVNHPQPNRQQAISDSTRRQRELSPPVAQPTGNEHRLQLAERRQFETLPKTEQNVISARQAVESERAEIARRDALAQLLSSPKATKTLATIDRLILLAQYDEAVSQSDLDELNHQRRMLLTYGDADAASVNVRIVQDRLFDTAKASADEARQHADRATARQQALLSGREDFDVDPLVATDLLGVTTATMTYAGQTVTVPVDQYEGRSTPELLARHFGIEVTPAE